MLLTSPLSSPLKNPVRDVFSPAGSSQSLTAQAQALFAGGKVGGMWDMGDTSKLFQDSATLTTPVTTAGQTIGLVLDSKSTTLDATVITNGDFSVGTGWTMPAGVSISSGALRCTAAGGYVYQNATSMTSGAVYKVTYTVSNYSGGSIKAYVNASPVFGFTVSANGVSTGYIRAGSSSVEVGFNLTGFTGDIDDFSVCCVPGNHATQPTAGSRSLYQVVGGYGCAQFDATDDALLFPAITFGGAFNTFVAGKVTGGTRGIHLWRTADVGSGFFGVYESASGASPSGLNVGAPTYAINGTALSPSTRGQIYTQANGVDVVLESIGVVLSAETALQLSGYPGYQFQGNSHRVLMISGTLTAAEKLLCRQWCAEGNGVTVV